MKTLCSVILFAAFILFAKSGNTQDLPALKPVGVGEKMGDFTLKTAQGDEISMAKLAGKNVLLVIPRGKVTPKVWCPFCYYQYAEIAQLAKKENWGKKYNLEVMYLLPYSKDSIPSWKKGISKGMATIEKWKNPDSYKQKSKEVEEWIAYMNQFYPQKFELVDGEMELSIPIVMDEDHSVSSKLDIFKEEWGGTKVQQNVPTVFLMDKDGVIRFKYHSQYTNDRVSAAYLSEIMKKML